MKLGVRAKLFLLSLVVIAACVAVGEIYVSTTLDGFLVDAVRDDLFVRADLAAAEAARGPTAGAGPGPAWDALADDLGRRARARVTFVREDGAVLGDSEVPLESLAAVENHASRPEVAEALAGRRGSTTRLSGTVGVRFLYVALPFAGPGGRGVARVARPLAEVDATIARVRRIVLAGGALALGLALVLASAAAGWAVRDVRHMTQIARRMAEGHLEARVRSPGQDELAQLGQALDRMAGSLSGTIDQLRSERDLLDGVLGGMQEGVLVLGSDGRVVLVNAALRAMLLLGADAAGRAFLEVVRHAELKELLDRAHRGRAPATEEIELAGLKPRRLLVHAAPNAGPAGGLVAVFFDVTDVRRLESVRRDFVANVSHELRTPVTAVRSAAETLRAGALADPAAARSFLEMIERNAERLERLVSDLLDLARIEAREYRLVLEPLDLEPLAALVGSLHRAPAEARRLHLRTELAPDLPRVRADRRALETVLANLVDNAVKYATEGTAVAIRAAARGDLVSIAVADQGPGIEPRHLPRLFERFYRVDPGRSRAAGGTGLGLSIVKHLAEAMGGSVSVDSGPAGSTFTVTLPRAEGASTAGARASGTA